ncbi:restriction endonuclease subunit S [Aurantiacibacter marinus]|uniref:Type I restriction modification DNA specificity domain-containing protein n=1 Tax=Aurantiacibacter marinus TaxID=874156 RepID=A0A0H0XP05_9SPHN|nr:restriction endonuclease subunit S [Aurantiacibacter marinus]KLI63687.1 hypothetical protein AAV99_08105 [Aurantiacibacter marinus]
MAQLVVRPFEATKLDLPQAATGLEQHNHILEPEFHQDQYVDAVLNAAGKKNAFQLGDETLLVRSISRGRQPEYADDDCDLESLSFEGMLQRDGTRHGDDDGKANVCALKSNCIRNGFIDFDLARSVSRAFFTKVKDRSSVQKGDLLINSTGDGTIGRVAVYGQSFPAVVDGHVSIIRFKDPTLSWYSASYLMSDEGRDQLYRYINGSSGQVEIYPQDIARIWIPGDDSEIMLSVAEKLRSACDKHDKFYEEITDARAHFL